MEPGNVEVRFLRHVGVPEELSVTEKAFQVPSKAGRHALSGLLNHLLALEQHRDFDFLINNEFVRTSLAEHLQQRGRSLEAVVPIEYVLATPKPTPQRPLSHEDWVSALCGAVKGLYLSGSYDTTAKVWQGKVDSERECLLTCVGHKGPVRALDSFSDSSEKTLSFVTASKDHRLIVWDASPKSKTTSSQTFCSGHAAAVESVAVCPNSSWFCSGSWDGKVIVWNKENATQPQKPTKRRRTAQLSTKELAPEQTLEAHSQCVSSVLWPENSFIVSAGWDHAIKIWDSETKTVRQNLNCPTVAYSLSYNASSTVVASGHADRVIRLWDTRIDEGSLVWKSLISHKDWVSSVAWDPSGKFLLSGSYDKTVKLWDIRSNSPLHTLEREGKCLTVGWDTEGNLLAGGADCEMNVWNLANLTQK